MPLMRRALAALLLGGAAPLARGLSRAVSLEVADSARALTVLEGSLRASDGGGDGDPSTFVPSCDAYRDLPCACGHARFDAEGGRFGPGWHQLWHLPSLRRMLAVQAMFRRGASLMEHLGPHYWHSSGFGNFKNSFDVAFFIASAYTGHFPEACDADAECTLTASWAQVVNWLVTLKQFSLFPMQEQLEAYVPMLDAMGGQEVAQAWREAPWHLLVWRPGWAEAFAFVVAGLEDLMAADGAPPLERSASAHARLERALQRMGAGGACADAARAGAGAAAAAAQAGRREAELAVRGAAAAAFSEACPVHPVRRLVVFAAAAHAALLGARGAAAAAARGGGPAVAGGSAAPLWPEDGAPLEAHALAGPLLGRLCGGLQHRRVGEAELHFLAADVVRVGGGLQLDLLWMATSDDDCAMVGTNIHNPGEAYHYYSFAHTLPAAHLVHWDCAAALAAAPGAPGGAGAGGAGGAGAPRNASGVAATVSFSGFLSVTTCALPAGWASALQAPGAALEVLLRPSAPGGWRPEPLRVCSLPRPRRRFLSACTTTLHGADRIDGIAPHAVEDWINYHLLIGVEHVTVFDTDGSYEPYVRRFVRAGVVAYHPRFPAQVSPKLGAMAAGLRRPEQQRAMLLEPHALDVCVWENRQVSEWVVVVHSFEEYLHSPGAAAAVGQFSLAGSLRQFAQEVPGTAVFELFQEPMGGARRADAPSVLSAWTHKRGLEIVGDAGSVEALQMSHAHFQPFAWIVDPINVLQTAVHFAQARAEGQAIVVLPQETLRVNHYVDLGANASRCVEELGGCDVEDASILWAEPAVLAKRRGRGGAPKAARRA